MAVRSSQETLETVLQPSPAVRATQDVVEVVIDTAAVAPVNVRISQEILEVVLEPPPVAVLVSQEVLEAVVEVPVSPPGETGEFTVEADPRVRWLATVPVNEFTVRTSPQVRWDAVSAHTGNVFVVHTVPVVVWNTGPGAADTKCISADGVMPPPDDDTPPDVDEQNYVF